MMNQRQSSDPDFENLIRYIQESRGLDFRGYKRTSLQRRITLRMKEVDVEDFDGYQAFLEVHPQEFIELLNTVLINVTSFFRDREAWEVVRREIVPSVLARAGSSDPIRIWSVGCASGEEPYSIAMLFAEAMGIPEFCRRVKVYATDLDEDALRSARHAAYSWRDVEELEPEFVERYFEQANGQYVFQRELRKCVIFGRHNVVHDAPISRIDLLLCRNLLIYLETDTQNVVLPRLHYALIDDGVLFLGKAETQLARSKLFRPLNTKYRLFQKVPQEWRRSVGGSLGLSNGVRPEGIPPQLRLLEAIVDDASAAYIVVNEEGDVIFANGSARRMLEVGEGDIGKPFQDLSISYRPSELRGRIEEARRLGRPLRIEHQDFHRPPAEPIRLTVEIRPLMGRDNRPYATLLSFTDTTRTFVLQQELEAAQESLETTIEELQSANEELETTNEELQSTNEELETTNEELQSTNEELETMNEELRSTNEELEAANEELRLYSEQAGEFRSYAESVLRSVNDGIIVLNSDGTVRSWNRWSENTWGLRAEEVVGQRFADLDIGLPVKSLQDDVMDIMSGQKHHAERVISGIDRRGRSLTCRVRLSALMLDDRSPQGVVLIIEDLTEERDSQGDYFGRVVKASLNEIYFLDPDTLRFMLVNHGAEQKLGLPAGRLLQMSFAEFIPNVSLKAMQRLIQPLRNGAKSEVVFETTIKVHGGQTYPAEICLQYLGSEHPPVVLAMVHDTTDRQQVGLGD
jgi:two-component system CheB/CheR fusion protein